MANFAEECLHAHNNYRSKHQVSPLQLNPQIGARAQAWADQLASIGTMQIPTDRIFESQTLGVNLSMSSGGDGLGGQKVASQWYDNLTKYDFASGQSSNPSAGSFTQLVWKETKQLGVGRAKSSDGKWFVVAYYLPAGNMKGKYKENVFAAK